MKKIVSETIDGSMQDIIQLKTLDNSLEYSQMFDALEDTPRDFQTKLIGALNSLSQTMGVSPADAFNQVMCASNDESQDVKQRLYNWWRGFFEVLGQVSSKKMPKDQEQEYQERIDDLVAEIMKAGDAEATDNGEPVVAESRSDDSIRFMRGDIVDWTDPDTGEVHRGWEVGRSSLDRWQLFPPDGGMPVWVDEYYMDKVSQMNEEYETATKKEEGEMLKDFDFAVQHIGEIANKVKDVVNFVNPYCESGDEEDTSMKAKALTRDELVKLVWGSKTDEMEVHDWRAVKGMDLVEFDVFVKNTGQLGDGPATSVAEVVDVAEDVVGDVISRAGWDFDVVPVADDITVQMWNGEDFDGKVDVYNDQTRLGDSDGAMFKVVCTKHDMNDNDNTMKDNMMTNEKVGSDWISMDDLIGKEFNESDNGEGDWSGKFKVGDQVMWNDPEYDEWTDGWTVVSAPDEEDAEELSPEDAMYTIERDDGSEAEVLGSELRSAKMMNEAQVTVDADDVWAVLDLLDDEVANKNLTDLINSHVRTEVEIMDAIDGWCDETVTGEAVTKAELNDWIANDMESIVTRLGLDVKKFKETGEFVDPEKPVTLEGSDDNQKPDELKGSDKQFSQDGETKTLVTGSETKERVNEMTVEQEIDDPWKLFELLWGQGKDNFRDLLESELIDDDTLMMMLEDMEIKNLTSINDAFAYDFPTILDMLGLDGKAWSQNLEIKRKDDNED